MSYSTEGDAVGKPSFKESAKNQRERRLGRAQRAAAKAQVASLKNQGTGSKVRKKG